MIFCRPILDGEDAVGASLGCCRDCLRLLKCAGWLAESARVGVFVGWRRHVLFRVYLRWRDRFGKEGGLCATHV